MQGDQSGPSDVFQASLTLLSALFVICFILANITPHPRILDDTLIRAIVGCGSIFLVSVTLSYASLRATRMIGVLQAASRFVFALGVLSLTLFLLVSIFE